MAEKLSPFEIANNINEKKGLLDEDEMSAYSGWMINKIFSMTSDTVLFANEMNQNYHLEKDMQYSFFYHGLDKKKRYGVWRKREKMTKKMESVITLLMEKYAYSEKRAYEIVDLMSDKDLDDLKEEFSRGGATKVGITK